MSPFHYVVDGDLDADRWFGWIPRAPFGELINFHLTVPASALRSGTFQFYTTNFQDEAFYDNDVLMRLSGRAGLDVFSSLTAHPSLLTLPSGSVHLSGDASGFTISLPDTDIALGANADECMVNLENEPGFIGMLYTNSANGADDELDCMVSGRRG